MPPKVVRPQWARGNSDPRPEAQDNRIEWLRVLPFLMIHVGCVLAFFTGISWVAIGLAIALYFVRMFAITGFYHRYFSHRSFKTSRAMQFIFALVGNSAAQRGPLWWASWHRHHHGSSDKPDDMHSPVVHGFFFSHVGWIMSREGYKTWSRRVGDFSKYRELRALERFDWVVPLALAALLFGLGELLAYTSPGLGTTGMQLLCWSFCVSTVAVYHGTFTINSLSHVWGKRRFATKDDSRNNWVLALITLGEGWHNNHHHYPASTRQGFYWWEIDITYWGLRLMSALGLVWDLNPVPANVLASGRKRD